MGGSSDSGNSGWGERIGADVFDYAATRLGGPIAGAAAREVGAAAGRAAENAWNNSMNSGIHPDYDNYTAMGDYGGQPGQRYD
jgi:hypothetical protein